MRIFTEKCDIFFWIERRLRKEEMEEQLNREAKEGLRFAAYAVRITHEKGQVVKTGSVRQDESSWQSTAAWEQFWEQRKTILFRSQVTKEESPKHG